MFRYRWRMAALFAATLAAAVLWMAADPAPSAGDDPHAGLPTRESVYRAVGPQLARQLPRHHLLRRPLDEAMSARAFDLFVTAMDPDRTFFTQEDIRQMRAEAGRFDVWLRNGDLGFARRAFERLKERVRDRVAFAERMLAQPATPEPGLVYRWRRRDEPWPENDAARDELWRLKLLNEVVARRVAVHLAAEAAATDKASEKPGNDTPPEDRDLSPEAFVLKRYRQYLLMLQDSDDEWIADRFFSAFTQAYDPHSEYMSAIRSEDFDINMKLSLTGIGAVLSAEDGLVRIVRLIPGGPAERDGRLRPNDRIVAVAQGDGPSVEVMHWPLYKVVRLIRGEIGTRVVLTVWPASDLSGGTERKIELVRDEVRLEDKAARGRVRVAAGKDGRPRRLAVITLPDFYADFKGLSNGEDARRSARDVRRLIETLTASDGGVEGVLLDLRNNGGGSLPDAIELAGLFLRGGPVLQVRSAGGVQILSDPDDRQLYAGPLVVLVNRLSASASEIVAAALQDYRRAVIVGDSKTHGKGTVQSLMPLNPRDEALGSLKVTTAAFYRIAGGSTQRRGVEPDIVMPSVFDATEVGEEFLPHALEWSALDPVFYTVFARAFPNIVELRRASEERRSADPRFEALNRLRKQVEERTRSAVIPLDWEARLAYSRAERELERAERDLEPDNDRVPESDDKDIILEEALQILADIAAWREGQGREKPPETESVPPAVYRRSLAERVCAY